MINLILFALFVAGLMVLVWRRSRRRSFLVLALLWAAYSLYEYLMLTRVLCSGDCNIRVDLLLIYPALLGSTLWVSLTAVVRAFKHGRQASSGA